eukprot:comp12671_c0_seq1/m.7753 comp12671_c0_seq1/g.7753  ORF comp12671_c0_seq1/g.7753 comp12671_c0_seq1/m.7753 type:complete len:141 (-) comp12671_c0_seq1:525-947(-)
MAVAIPSLTALLACLLSKADPALAFNATDLNPIYQYEQLDEKKQKIVLYSLIGAGVFILLLIMFCIYRCCSKRARRQREGWLKQEDEAEETARTVRAQRNEERRETNKNKHDEIRKKYNLNGAGTLPNVDRSGESLHDKL